MSKKLQLSLAKSGKAGLFDSNAFLPPGISNTANNCYASSVVQCLMNHGGFLQLCHEITGDANTEKTSGRHEVYVYIIMHLYLGRPNCRENVACICNVYRLLQTVGLSPV